ncbi:hypothetical protein STEG23_016738 [Scotinomys teguina]
MMDSCPSGTAGNKRFREPQLLYWITLAGRKRSNPRCDAYTPDYERAVILVLVKADVIVRLQESHEGYAGKFPWEQRNTVSSPVTTSVRATGTCGKDFKLMVREAPASANHEEEGNEETQVSLVTRQPQGFHINFRSSFTTKMPTRICDWNGVGSQISHGGCDLTRTSDTAYTDKEALSSAFQFVILYSSVVIDVVED